MNLDRADAIESGDPRVREMRGLITRLRDDASGGKATVSAAPHVMVPELPDVNIEPGAPGRP